MAILLDSFKCHRSKVKRYYKTNITFEIDSPWAIFVVKNRILGLKQRFWSCKLWVIFIHFEAFKRFLVTTQRNNMYRLQYMKRLNELDLINFIIACNT